LNDADVPYRRVDYNKVADNWADLTNGTLDAAITVDENGATVTTQLTVYTKPPTQRIESRHRSRMRSEHGCGRGLDLEWSAGLGHLWNGRCRQRQLVVYEQRQLLDRAAAVLFPAIAAALRSALPAGYQRKGTSARRSAG
jgi:hypothetical protein